MNESTHPLNAVPDAHGRRTTHLDITVLAGGPSDEREVSLASGQCVAGALARLGHRVSMRDVNPSDLSALDRHADVVFIALHGAFGEDGEVQAELERRGIPFTGSGAAASAVAMNKVLAKTRFLEAGLPTPVFDVARAGRISPVAERWRPPVVVKPVQSGSSVDTYLIYERAGVQPAIHDVVRKHGEALVEELIEGHELTVGVLDGKPLPAIEICTGRPFYDYQAKYIDDDTEYLFDIPVPAAMLKRLYEQSVQAMAALGCRDFGRVDWMVDAVTHEAFILEINTIPGFTSHSLLPKAAARAGWSFADLCQCIVDLTLRRAEAKPGER